jgi:hypothetical protein
MPLLCLQLSKCLEDKLDFKDMIINVITHCLLVRKAPIHKHVSVANSGARIEGGVEPVFDMQHLYVWVVTQGLQTLPAIRIWCRSVKKDLSEE